MKKRLKKLSTFAAEAAIVRPKYKYTQCYASINRFTISQRNLQHFPPVLFPTVREKKRSGIAALLPSHHTKEHHQTFHLISFSFVWLCVYFVCINIFPLFCICASNTLVFPPEDKKYCALVQASVSGCVLVSFCFEDETTI